MDSARNSRRRINSIQTQERLQRRASAAHSKRPVAVTAQDAYLYALRVAYLHYLLLPRQKRVQHVAAPKPVQRATTGVTDLVKDFGLVQNSKSMRFPHGFMAALEKRLTKVLMGQERMPEFKDATVIRTFAVFLNEFKDPRKAKNLEKNRNVEELILIFFSNATKELQKGKPPGDDSYKLMVDRHVALFLRLISAILKDHDWQRDRPELSQRLVTMEKKLLLHDQDLASENQRNGGQGGSTIEVEIPRTYEVKDMPLVLVVQRIFSLSYSAVQADIDRFKPIWTEKAALQDLKTYQVHLTRMTKQTLNRNDFDSDEAYEAWKSQESPDLSQMILSLIQSDPNLAKSTSTGPASQYRSNASVDLGTDNGQPVDLSGLNINADTADDQASYVFIPPDPRMYYRAILKEALTYDLADPEFVPSDGNRLSSKQSAELLAEIGHRWRVPQSSRHVLFLDVIRDAYIDQSVDLDMLDTAFTYVKEPPQTDKKSNRLSQFQMQVPLSDRSRWTVHDHAVYQQILTSIHETLLRELFEMMMSAYDAKAPSIGPIMEVLDTHIYSDDLFTGTPEDLDQFGEQLKEALRHKAGDVYRELLAKQIPDNKEDWQFYHVIQLGKAISKLCEKIQKRYRKMPPIMGVEPLSCLVEEMLPAYAADARDLVARIMDVAESKDEHIPIDDGFDLYKEMVEIRRIHNSALPGRKFAFNIEDLLQDFVWRWIEITDSNLIAWVNNAFKADQFQIESQNPFPSDDERHSTSVVDIFRSFNQSVEQIMDLNWDNDVQYAKFMTAASKSIGIALARYCELVEQKFTKEMDRVTPEQEAAARQTTQEKWLSRAKDLYNQKEKVEPFQFWPEVS